MIDFGTLIVLLLKLYLNLLDFEEVRLTQNQTENMLYFG
jgi:hypothetical protein